MAWKIYSTHHEDACDAIEKSLDEHRGVLVHCVSVRVDPKRLFRAQIQYSPSHTCHSIVLGDFVSSGANGVFESR